MKGLRVLVRAAGVLLALFSAAGDSFAQQQSVRHVVDDYGGSFSPDGRTIVFERWFSTQRHGIDTHPLPKRAVLLLMRADGSHKRVLRHIGARFEHSASFSPDGRSIVFVRDARIHVMRRDGTGVRALRHDVLEQACPRFSPDGRKLSFWRGSLGAGGHYVMDADGTNLRRIGSADDSAWGCPSWFPDGKRLVFARSYNLYVASADGKAVARITDDADGWFYRPHVAPDGRRIACDGYSTRHGYGIMVLRADGSALRRITTGSGEIENDAASSWSSDGRKIAFSGYRGFEGAGVYIVNRDGRGLRRLSNFAR